MATSGSVGYAAVLMRAVTTEVQVQTGSSGSTVGSTKTTSRYQTSKTQETVVHNLTDDGAGGLGEFGTVNYAGKTLTVRLVDLSSSTEGYKSDYEDASAFETTSMSGGGSDPGSNSTTRKGGDYADSAVSEQLLAGSTLRVTYATDFASDVANTMTFRPPTVTIDLCPYTSEYIVPGSVRFTWMGHVYEDFEGVLYRAPSANSRGTVAGQINYSSGIAQVTDYVVSGSATDFSLDSLFTVRQKWSTASLFFCTDAAPLRAGAGGFVLTVTDLTGAILTANVDAQGNITGLHMRGKLEFSRGQVELQFGDYVLDTDLTPEQKAEWWYSAADVGTVQADKIWRPWPVDPTTMRYSAVSYIYLPVDVSLMGLDPAALPADGRVAYARPGDTCVVGVMHGGVEFAPFEGQVYDLGHERLSFVQVLSADDDAEIFTGYTADLDAGTIIFDDLVGYPARVKVVGRTEVYRQIAEVRIDGRVRLTQPVGYAFPADAVFSTALRQGDRFARVSRVYDQASWDGVTWLDGLDPANGTAMASFDAANYPITLSNRGAITERWALRMRPDGHTFDLIGQHLGQIASGSINEDFSPLHQAAGVPYMTVPSAGWNAGWVAGNVLFVDTIGAEAPVACVRCTQPGTPAGMEDEAWLVQRGDVGRAPESTFD